jgi:hypothetical protein
MPLPPCPYLGVLVELTDERRRHILLKHPDLLPKYIDYVAETLAEPDDVRRDSRFPATRVFEQDLDNLRRKDSLRGAETAEISVRLGNYSASHFEGSAFARWCESVKGGKLVVVVMVSDPPPMERYGVVTAYIARKLTQGVIEWKRAC